ncbi:hypothetical protein L486_01180 [Kwoniella mangroviensis CBS 10435]|uniref:Mitochondrial import inner membrane translocase subunit TIM16 n=1 Tax=Kwoniella mangroviensis CBS 10435 TaxID=1331196 RepID=A0A1B9J164_9TREE|nr:uncharacterized protein I203_07447 [Kwoniella mangroviensis CBS 8507]OCF61530.1 hypothetical protein L486_01180 [Kwoniella mangroviensis CBS 10435]OCF63381.1 hypothetical protein I203_07447 [Kwoniella mangroviensis CBS 8507]
MTGNNNVVIDMKKQYTPPKGLYPSPTYQLLSRNLTSASEMSAPRVIAELVVTGIRVLGKATAAAGQQAVRNFKHKPEGAPDSGPVGTGSSKNKITSQLNMSLDEAHLILNVKKDDPMEVIQKHYDSIFTANGPPTVKPETHTTPSSSAKKSSRTPTHSHYLQSKVFRALERIKAEREAEAPPPPSTPEAPIPTPASTIETSNPISKEATKTVKEGETVAPPPPPGSV